MADAARYGLRASLATALAKQTNMHSVEIAKDMMPTIGLHAIRMPSGAPTKKLHETANNLYAIISGIVRTTIDGQAEGFLGGATYWQCQCGTDTFCTASKIRLCCGSPTSR